MQKQTSKSSKREREKEGGTKEEREGEGREGGRDKEIERNAREGIGYLRLKGVLSLLLLLLFICLFWWKNRVFSTRAYLDTKQNFCHSFK